MIILNRNIYQNIFEKICTIMTIPAYYKGKFSTLDVLARVIIIFIKFDDLTHFKKICMIIQFL